MKKRLFKRTAAVGLTLAMVIGSLNFGGLSANAGLPTTDGHDKYVNKSVFDVIGAEDFGSKDLDNPLFDKTTGSQNITDLQVPTLAYDDTSIGLVWQKPEKYDNIADYKVWINDEPAGTARENFKVNAEWTAKYMEAFYDYYATASDVEMVKVDIHSYRATNLQPDTEYTFKVVAVDDKGVELGTPQTLTQKTTKTPETVNILDYGAQTSDGYTSYDDAINEFIVNNTKAIQAAIDACPEGGKVVIPEGTFVSGALWLKSNMTLEINGTLWASPNSDHFEVGFLMYPFYTDTRVWGLVNAVSADEGTPLENIRITGNGTLYGNGWKYGSGNTIEGDGYTRYTYKEAGDVDTSVAGNEKYALPRWVAGSNTKVYHYGVQAADTCIKWLKNIYNDDGSRKYSDEVVDGLADKIKANNGDKLSAIDGQDLKDAYAARASLLIMRNITNVYVGDITVENPSNHSVNILDSRNISATNVKVFSYDGNNGDGLGFGCSQNVICWNNCTDTGDDNLGFGASVGEGARDSEIQTNSEVWMFDNYLHEGHGGLAAGSHTGNGIQDVLYEDTVMNHIDAAFRFKSAPTNGGFIANITMRDCAVAECTQAFVLTTSYSDPNSASSTEAAEVAEFYNFAAYNISVYTVSQNTIQVLADVDPVQNPNKPWHTHHNLYFQDITFGDVGTNGKYKNKNGWETLIGCENAVFYNVFTKSYSSKAVSAKTNVAWNNVQFCKNIRFQGTTLTSTGADATKLQNIMSGITVTNNTVTAQMDDSVPDGGWVKNANECTGFFNDVNAADVPKLETKNTPNNIGYIYNNEKRNSKAGNIGFAYPKCDVTGLTKLKLNFENRAQTEGANVSVSVHLDKKNGTKIAEAAINGEKAYKDYEMSVTLPDGVTGTHDLYCVFTCTGETSSNYIGNARTLTGVCTASADSGDTTDSTDGCAVKLSWNAVTNDTGVFYGVDTYVDGVKVDTVDGITDTSYVVNRLSSGVNYTFKVYVSENGDNANSMKVTGWNKTPVGEVTFKTEGDKDTTPIKEPADKTVTTGTTIYTHTQGEWKTAAADNRVRGYKIYANDVLVKTIYNYELPNYSTAATVKRQIGRLTPGTENSIKVVAFTDAGVELAYDVTTATTLGNYDYKAPVFAEGSALTAEVKDDGSVVLKWSAATDDTAVGGYRVYVDGEPVYANDGDEFNPVNGDKTTDATTYTITDLDLTEDHTYTVQAGDTWWKAAQTMGSYDKMAGYNWTVKGLSTTTTGTVEGAADYKAVDAAIKAANALVKDNYVDFTAVDEAIAAVVRDLKETQQSDVDAMAKAINDAVAALQLKPADYSKVDEAVAAAGKLNADNYKDFTAVTAAVNAVVRDYTIDKQSEVDAMAKAINDAVAALQLKPADYSKVDEAVEAAGKLNADDYKDFTAVTAAVNAVVRDYTIDKQSEVDAMAKAINDAVAALEKKPGTTPDPDAGEIKVDTDSDITVTEKEEEIADKLLTDEEKKQYSEGAKITVNIKIEDIKDTVTAEDKAAVEKLLKGETLGQYVDISVFKTVGSNPQTKIAETKGALKISIKLPENLKNTDSTKKREYYVVRVHDGVATKLSTVYNESEGTLTFESDKFSTYAIVYSDTAVGNEAPPTGDNTFTFVLMLMALLLASGSVLVFGSKRRFVK